MRYFTLFSLKLCLPNWLFYICSTFQCRLAFCGLWPLYWKHQSGGRKRSYTWLFMGVLKYSWFIQIFNYLFNCCSPVELPWLIKLWFIFFSLSFCTYEVDLGHTWKAMKDAFLLGPGGQAPPVSCALLLREPPPYLSRLCISHADVFSDILLYK